MTSNSEMKESIDPCRAPYMHCYGFYRHVFERKNDSNESDTNKII